MNVTQPVRLTLAVLLLLAIPTFAVLGRSIHIHHLWEAALVGGVIACAFGGAFLLAGSGRRTR